jgi:hypothetical protein
LKNKNVVACNIISNIQCKGGLLFGLKVVTNEDNEALKGDDGCSQWMITQQPLDEDERYITMPKLGIHD